MSVRRSRAGIALWIAFLAGAGVLATGLVALWLALQSSVQREARRAAEAAEAKASVAQALIRDPDWVGALPSRFGFDSQSVHVPDAVGWIGLPEPVELRSGVLELLDEVAALEFDDDPEAGRALQRARSGLEQDGGEPADAEAIAVAVRQAWWLQRRGRRDEAVTVRRELAKRLASAKVRTEDWIGALLLGLEQAGAEWTLPEWASVRIGHLPIGRARALLAMLKARCEPMAVQLAALGREVDRVADLRRRLEVASNHHAAFASNGDGTSISGAEWVVLVPAGDGEPRPGAVLTWAELRDALRTTLRATPGLEGWDVQGLVLVEDDAAHEVQPVLGDRLGIRYSADSGGMAVEPLQLAGLLLTLGAVCAVGLFVAFRALRREAAATAVRADFMVSVTHELKTPLASIRLLSEMLERGTVRDPDRRREYHRLLAGESLRLNGLIENVLDLGRIERGERGFDRREQALDPVVEEVLALFGPVAERDGLDLSVQLDAPDAIGSVDRGALTQVVWNLVDNARKYAAQGQRLEVSSNMADGCWRLRVRDHGPGIAAAERAAVFDPFVRADAHRDGSVPGVGLGLYLSRSIAKSHGGELRLVESGTGSSGACFELALPVVPAGSALQPQEAT